MPVYGTAQAGGVLTHVYAGTPFVLFKAEAPSTPQASVAIDAPYEDHTLQVVANASGSIRLEGSLDGANWADLSGPQAFVSGVNTFHVDGKQIQSIRAYLISGSATVTVAYIGGPA